MFVNVSESIEAPEMNCGDELPKMNYWMIHVLLNKHQVDGQQVFAQDASGEDVKPLQAACLLQNVGAWRFSRHASQAVLDVLMRIVQERGELEWMVKILQGSALQKI